MDTSTFSPGAELLKAFEGRNTRPDLSRFLIDFGLNLASASQEVVSYQPTEATKGPLKIYLNKKGLMMLSEENYNFLATQMDIDKKLKEEFADKKFANDLALALATAKPETKTAAVKNALAMGLEPGTKAFNDYVTASTIKGSGLNIEFDDQGNLKSISQGGVPINKKFQEQAMELKNATFAMNNVASALLNNLQGAKVQTVGSFFNVLDSFGSQLKQLADSTVFLQTIQTKERCY